MSNINLQWVQENFKNQPCVIFNIGCADLADDSLRFKISIPNSDVYSFDCAEHCKLTNLEKSKSYNLHYEHVGISYFDGQSTFYNKQSNTDKLCQYAGMLSNAALFEESWDAEFWKTKTVNVMSLNTFCQKNKVKPDFLHMDVEGEEYNVLKNLKKEFWPKIIWLEYWDTYRDHDQDRVPYSVLDKMLQDRHYDLLHKKDDVLYVRKDFKTTNYTDYVHGESLDPQTLHEIELQQKIWLYRYNLIRDPSWPVLDKPSDYFNLPPHIKDECDTVYNLTPTNSIC